MGKTKGFRWGKWLAILLVLGAAGAGGWYYYKTHSDTGTEYQTSEVTRGDLTQVVTATGQLGPVVNVQVGSQISGIVKKLFIDYNSTVKSNQVIAEIDPSTYEINVMKAEAQLANTKANLSLSLVQERRAEQLFKNNLISGSDHDTAKAQLQQAEAQVLSDEASLKNARVQLSYCTIFAPVDGVVVSRNVDVGQTVAASFNTPTVAVIANDLTKMQIDALVSEADIGGVAVGQDVNFSVDAYPYRTFKGKVNQIRYGAITNQNVINYDCVIGVSNADLKLLPGMTANVSIIIAQRENVLRVPNAAFRFRPPETVAAEVKTNLALLASAGPRAGGDSNRPGGMRGPGGGGRGGGGEGGAPGMGQRSGGPGGAGGGSRMGKPERQSNRTVYILPAKADKKSQETVKTVPVQIKTGITDGIMTEVLDGVDEGAQVVTGAITTGDSSAKGPAANPFGGGFRRF